jgi:hypothetical protein
MGANLPCTMGLGTGAAGGANGIMGASKPGKFGVYVMGATAMGLGTGAGGGANGIMGANEPGKFGS